MFKDEKKGFIETLVATFSKNTFKKIKKAQITIPNSVVNNRITKILDKNGDIKMVDAHKIKKGTTVIVEAGDIIPCDGEVIEGLALVDESAITGESIPVIKEAGGDFCLVSGDTRVASNWLKIKVTETTAQSCFDKIISVSENTAI